MTTYTSNRITLTVIIPLFMGGLIYILFRTDSLRMFQWFETIGLAKIIYTARQLIIHSYVPSWTIFSLPDALLVFSFTNFVLIVWHDNFSRQSIPWIFIAPALGLLTEIGQAFHLIRGTFDLKDLTLILIAGVIPFIISFNNLKTRTI